jgi:hypothetical protein
MAMHRIALSIFLFATAPAIAQPRPMPGHIYGVTVDDISGLKAIALALADMPRFPAVRIVFDKGEPVSYYTSAVNALRPYAYIMAQPVDSSDAKAYSLSGYANQFQKFWNAMSQTVDLWEVGNEVNGNWLGTGIMDKVQSAFDIVHGGGGHTMLTFFYMGEAKGANCNDAAKDDMFTWIDANFPASNPNRERMRLGLTQVSISWYPDQCSGVDPDWSYVFTRLASIFPNSRVGFGEVGTANPQNGSAYEKLLATTFYSLHTKISLPANYSEGVFWWYWRELCVPDTQTMWSVIANAIMQNP